MGVRKEDGFRDGIESPLMKRLRILSCILILCLCTAYGQETKGPAWGVEPGKGIGPLQLGQNLTEVMKILGPPYSASTLADANALLWEYPNKGIKIYADPGDSLVFLIVAQWPMLTTEQAETLLNTRPMPPDYWSRYCGNAPRITAPSGLGLYAPVAQCLQVYGQPNKREPNVVEINGRRVQTGFTYSFPSQPGLKVSTNAALSNDNREVVNAFMVNFP